MLGKEAVSIAERRVEAVELRKEGFGYEEIARRVGFANAGGAYKAVMAALREMLQEPCDELRRMELEQINDLWRVCWTQAVKGDDAAFAKVIKLMDRRAKLLGLDAPVKAEKGPGDQDGATRIVRMEIVRSHASSDPDPTEAADEPPSSEPV